MEEGLSNMQIAILKREYAPFKGKTISAARAKQLMNILDKFKADDLKKLSKANIPFVSSGSASKLAVRNMGVKITNFNPMGSFKEEITQEDFDLEEGKMKTIATMFSQGKSAEEIAKKMKLPVDKVKNILGENAPTDADMKRLKKLGMKPQKEDIDEAIKPFMLSYSDRFGKHAGFEDAKTLQDLQTKAANLRKKGFKIDKMGRYNPPVNMKDAFDPLTEACWTGYKQVGMKKKGDKMVPNCVPENYDVNEHIEELTEQDDKKKMKKADVAPDGDAEHAETTDEKKEKKEGDSVEKLKADIEKKDNEIQSLKVKAETEKAKVAKKETEKMVNPETGEPLLQVGVAYKHLRDKMKKEKIKEDADYLKPRLNPTQIANIKKTWQDKKPGDVTPAVKKMIKNMDIPTQLAIKHADIKFLSGLVEDIKEGKFTRYSELLIQYGRFMQAKDYMGARRIKKDIEAEKKKLGIKEDLNQDDEKVIKKVKDMLKGASAKHAAQAKMIDKALKNEAFAVQITKKDGSKLIHGKYHTMQKAKDFVKWYKTGDMKDTKDIKIVLEADLTKSQIKKVHDKADDLPKKDFRDRYGKEKGDSVRYGVATKMIKKKLNIENKNHPSKELYETIKGLKNKADKSGMPYSILKKVYDRGMAAWRGGHRPGTTQQQWAFARVNSFVTKSSGTWGGADKDLAKQVRGSK